MFEALSVYNFTTISNTILNGEYKNLKVTANLGFKQAVRYSGTFSDVVTIRQKLVLETGKVLIDAEKARYILFEDTYGNELLLAEDWVVTDTIVLITSLSAEYRFDNLSTNDITIINNMLTALGHIPTSVNIIG